VPDGCEVTLTTLLVSLTRASPGHTPLNARIALTCNGFDLLGLNPLYEQIALGGTLLIAVGLDAWSRMRQS
jgi:hypothetical protein